MNKMVQYREMKNIYYKDQIKKKSKKKREITIKHHCDHRKHRYELVDEPKEQCNIIFIWKNLAVKVIMICRKTSGHNFKTKLRFKQYDVILTTVLKKLSSFEGENL